MHAVTAVKTKWLTSLREVCARRVCSQVSQWHHYHVWAWIQLLPVTPSVLKRHYAIHH